MSQRNWSWTAGALSLLGLTGCIGLSIGGRTVYEENEATKTRLAQLECRVKDLEVAMSPATVSLPAIPEYQQFDAPSGELPPHSLPAPTDP